MATGVGKSQKLAKRDAAEKALIKWRVVFGSL
jgi:dsRNA-specific ribonuclease